MFLLSAAIDAWLDTSDKKVWRTMQVYVAYTWCLDLAWITIHDVKGLLDYAIRCINLLFALYPNS